jgi:hypothetical protein
MNVMAIGYGGADRIPLVMKRFKWTLLVNTAVSLKAPLRTENFFDSDCQRLKDSAPWRELWR